MKLSSIIAPALSAAVFASTASAQVFSEIQNSIQGSDDPEFVEIEGAPGQSCDGLMILEVESETFTGSPAGRLQHAYDLSGNSFGAADKYFVFGSQTAPMAYPGTIDLASNDLNLFQNQSNTFYLVLVPDPVKRADILQNVVGSDVATAPGGNTTILATDPGITILDLVALSDGDVTDVFFDNAPVFGPDGPFYPAGIARNGSCPGDWCADVFLQFLSGPAMAPYIEETPGADNPLTTCMAVTSVGVCGSGGNGLGDPYCMANANSTGVAAVLTADGSVLIADNDVTLTVTSAPQGAFGYFLASLDQGFTPNPNMSSGNLCLGGSIGRYVGPGEIQNSGAGGTFSLAINLVAIPTPTGPVAAMPGVTWNFQSWFRDSDNGMLTSNFTQGLEITFQ